MHPAPHRPLIPVTVSTCASALLLITGAAPVPAIGARLEADALERQQSVFQVALVDEAGGTAARSVTPCDCEVIVGRTALVPPP